MDKFKQYIDVQWWKGIEKRDLENWIRNFGASKKIAELILNNVIFYNASQLKAYTRFLINKLQEQVYMETMKESCFSYVEDSILFEKWNEYLNKTNFLPAAKQTDPASSAHKIIGHWRSALGRGDSVFSTISDIENKYNEGVRRFILVDDFSGSGEQMQSVLKEKISFRNQEIELGLLPDVIDDIEIVIAVYVIHEKAKNILSGQYAKIELIYVDLINDEFNYLNERALIYEKYDDKKTQEIISEIKRITETIVMSNEELSKLSSYILNIPIVFEHGCPNNTLLLLFAHSDNWQQLFKRGKEL